ncbi:hypothetical protein GGI15_001224 [Coemansia interrupta]|uniref:Ribosomal RNA-processing protein 8 n=1 Tax=Coemansia interrupta TaxID=1126814 RepID=A0A9W8HRM9_9FUNG|nr:hypothetical protein GGI15_001224 [Coemansia interrupta]
MQQKLKGARFRWINEALYTTTGDKAFEMVQNDPRIFEEYHQGFSAQVEKWPVNPVDVFIKQLQQRDRLVVADMGCGEAKLAAMVGNQHTVHSFDLVAYNDLITPCNIADVPLADATADMVIFCLALMGTDFIKFIREANRILRQGGELKIAEVVSRITDVAAFVAELETQGFRLKHKDATNKMFIMLDFIKVGPFSEDGSKSNNPELLKPRQRAYATSDGKRQPQLYRAQRAVIFPGQGSQFIGMGKDLSERHIAARQVFEEVDDVLGIKLSEMMFAGNPQELMLTKNAQPAIVAVSVAGLRVLEHGTGMRASDIYSFAMGHSVGEYSALIAANVISLADGIRLVRTRGESMQDAVKERDYAMSACILRKSRMEDVLADVDRVQQELTRENSDSGEVVQVANINSSSQVVLSGTRHAVDRALASLQSKRLAMRAVNLPVSAPFHCSLMAPAKQTLASRIAELKPVRDPSVWTMPVISNVTAEPHATAESVETLLAEQVDRPVLWLQSMQFLKNGHAISRWGAMGPGNVVGNLVGKEFAKDIVRRLSDADALDDFIAVLDRQMKRGF